MDEVSERAQVTALLKQTIKTLCQKGLKFQTEFSIEGLLGITLDNKDIFLVNIKEIVKTAENGAYEEEIEIGPCMGSIDSQIMHRPEEIFPKRRKKRKSSTVNKRKVQYVESNSPNVCSVSNHCSLDSPLPSLKGLDDHLNNDTFSTGGKLIRNPFGDIPQLSDTDFALSSSCDDAIRLGTTTSGAELFNHSTTSAPTMTVSKGLYTDDSTEHLDTLQQSPKINFSDGIPLSDMGLTHCDNNSLGGDDWSNAIDGPLNLSEPPLKSVVTAAVKHEKTFPCDGCGKAYKSEYSLKKHRCKNSTGASPPPLLEGGTQPLDLSVPMATTAQRVDSFDSLVDLDADLALDNEQYLCICSRAFTDYGAYLEHVGTCQKAKLTPYKACEICGKYFFSNSGYVKHKRLHMGAYKFRCDVCHKGFFDRTHLRAHMDSSHSKVRRYECTACGKSFFWKHHLKRHLGTCERAAKPEAVGGAGGVAMRSVSVDGVGVQEQALVGLDI